MRRCDIPPGLDSARLKKTSFQSIVKFRRDKTFLIETMPQLTRDCLSAHDQKVLDSIFNPLQVGGEGVPNVFDAEISQEVQDPPEIQTPEVAESTKLELEGIQLTEREDLDGALEMFKRAIELAPNRASPYNNRAQTLRLKGNDDAAYEDLNKAITLSLSKGRTGCQAHCQRGVLNRKKENLDAAREDFEIAAKLGSKFARTQLVEINPYAALCNQMLRQAFEKLS